METQQTPRTDPSGLPDVGRPNGSVDAQGAAERIGDAATSTLSVATDTTKEVVGQASEQTRAVAQEAKVQAQQLLADTKSELQAQADARGRQAADHLRTMSGSISALLDGRPSDAGQMLGYLEQAKSKVDDVAQRIETRGPQGVIDDLSSFARRRPAVFLLAAGAAGFTVGRLARAGAAAAPQTAGGASTPQLSGIYGGQSQLPASATPNEAVGFTPGAQ